MRRQHCWLATGIAMAGLVLGSARLSSAQLVTNPSFETNDPTTPGSWGSSDWTLSAGSDPTYTFINLPSEIGPPYPAHTGSYEANFGQAGSFGTISQDIATTPGLYQISFWVRSDGYTPNELIASFGSVQGSDLVDLPDTTGNPTDNGYVQYSFNALTTQSTTTLQFSGRDDLSYLLLDDVSVSPTSIPEPVSLGLLGLASLALVMHRPRS